MFASMGERSKPNGIIFLSILLLLFLSFSPSASSSAGGSLKESLFPRIQVTLYNELASSVLYMCGMNRSSDMGLQELKPGAQTTYLFNQVGFPLRWCYVYINDQKNGFFWAYAVRQRCVKCFWRIADHLYLYRSDRNRWERQSMYSPHIKFKKLGQRRIP